MSSKFPAVHMVLTGACGSGQAAVAEHLSRLTGMAVADADTFHPATARRKIATGQNLCSADLTGQLHRMRDWIADRAVSGTSTIVICPPLSRASRDLLREAEGVAALTGQDATRLVFIELVTPGKAGPAPLEADEYGTSVDASGHPEDVAELVLDTVARMRSVRLVGTGSPSISDRLIAQAREAAEQ
ncbi:carbohydrate kinase [Corynebacterium terpenotabidum]|uniref:gluconokinase n=1 Tax=Corynebacterium terpenotabidum Y-11 TaxID=1200352 RepID=S4XBA3_9CORY|nr:carbohydrate kinase [Corynebacterium terpenotabidum]AGP29744.1 putative carbohydrate kinase [Corynebacterium terpenotabidum Y-11]